MAQNADTVVPAVEAFLRGIAGIRAGDRIVAAVSGGVDSIVLLDVLCHARARLGYDVVVAHLDHGLRPESAADAEFVASVAGARGLGLHKRTVDTRAHAQQARLSLEAAARELRYRFLASVRVATGSRYVATGHHASDQAETVLMRLLRGSGARGLAAIAPVRDGCYLRPLLALERVAIEQYATRRSLEYREDATNEDTTFLRNRIRHELLPQLESEYNPRLRRALGRTATVLRDEDDALELESRKALETVSCVQKGTEIILAAQQLRRYHIAIQRRVLRRLLEGMPVAAGGVGFGMVEVLTDLLSHEGGGGVRHLGADVWAQRTPDCLIIRQGSSVPFETSLDVPGVTRVPARDVTLTARFVPAASMAEIRPLLGIWRAVLDADAIDPGHLCLRSPRQGDRLQPLGMEGRKKISDLLVDEKWPRLLRDEVIVLTSDERIAWVAGLRVAHPFRVTPTSRQLLHLELGGDLHRLPGQTRMLE